MIKIHSHTDCVFTTNSISCPLPILQHLYTDHHPTIATHLYLHLCEGFEMLAHLETHWVVHVAVLVILESNHPLLHNILNYYITIMFSVSRFLLSLLDFVSLGLV